MNIRMGECCEVDDSDIRLAEITDLPFIENTYVRSGHEQLLNRIREITLQPDYSTLPRAIC